MTATTDIATAAATLGRKGGSAKSEAKTQTARANGGLGGRPKAAGFRGYFRHHETRVYPTVREALRAVMAWAERDNKSRGGQAPWTVDMTIRDNSTGVALTRDEVQKATL